MALDACITGCLRSMTISTRLAGQRGKIMWIGVSIGQTELRNIDAARRLRSDFVTVSAVSKIGDVQVWSVREFRKLAFLANQRLTVPTVC